MVAVLTGIVLVWRCHKRKQSFPDEPDSGTDIEMVCIHQVNDVFTLTAIQYTHTHKHTHTLTHTHTHTRTHIHTQGKRERTLPIT